MPALLAMLAVMTLALLLAMPSWRYLVRDDKEQELLFRGRQISSAIARFQRKNGNALPTSFEQLVQGKYLRRAYKDPLMPDGRWRIVRPGEAAPATLGGVAPPSGGLGQAPKTPTLSSPSVLGSGSGAQVGPIAGVASLSVETGLRSVNGTQNYSRWVFGPNIPLVIGGATAFGPVAPNQVPPSSRQRMPDLETPRLSR